MSDCLQLKNWLGKFHLYFEKHTTLFRNMRSDMQISCFNEYSSLYDLVFSQDKYTCLLVHIVVDGLFEAIQETIY